MNHLEFLEPAEALIFFFVFDVKLKKKDYLTVVKVSKLKYTSSTTGKRKKTKASLPFLPDGTKHGDEIHYRKSGRIRSIRKWKDGELAAETTFYKDGKIAREISINPGKLVGYNISYNKRGILCSAVFYMREHRPFNLGEKLPGQITFVIKDGRRNLKEEWELYSKNLPEEHKQIRVLWATFYRDREAWLINRQETVLWPDKDWLAWKLFLKTLERRMRRKVKHNHLFL